MLNVLCALKIEVLKLFSYFLLSFSDNNNSLSPSCVLLARIACSHDVVVCGGIVSRATRKGWIFISSFYHNQHPLH